MDSRDYFHPPVDAATKTKSRVYVYQNRAYVDLHPKSGQHYRVAVNVYDHNREPDVAFVLDENGPRDGLSADLVRCAVTAAKLAIAELVA